MTSRCECWCGFGMPLCPMGGTRIRSSSQSPVKHPHFTEEEAQVRSRRDLLRDIHSS